MDIAYPNQQLEKPLEEIDGYFVVNVPQTHKAREFIWWKRDSEGYTADLNNAKIFTREDLMQMEEEDPVWDQWWCKKFCCDSNKKNCDEIWAKFYSIE